MEFNQDMIIQTEDVDCQAVDKKKILGQRETARELFFCVLFNK